jgi:beta-lactamase regulating signal transducer with metallopeptidase domain
MTVLMAFVELVDLPGEPRQWLLFLADVSIKASFVLLAAGAAALILRGAGAALRHLVWALALGSLLVLPSLSLVLPEWRVPVPSIIAVETRAGPGSSPSAMPSGDTRPVRARQVPVTARTPELRPARAAPTTTTVASRVQLSDASSTGTEASRASLRVPALDGSVWALLIWWTGAWLVICVLGLGLFRVWRTARSGRPVRDREWLSLVDSVARRLEVARTVTLLETSRSMTPMTWGVRKPVILIPSSASAWSWSRRRDVLLHELAHIKRHDYLTQLCARYACALYWFNPLVWLAARQLRVEREHACDDEVLSAGAKPSEYAGHLLEIARSLKASSSTVFATVAMARPSQLTGRLLAVLDATRSRGAVTKTTSLVTWLVAVALIVPLACAQPASSATPEPAPLAVAEQAVQVLAVAPATVAERAPTVRPTRRGVPRRAGGAQAAQCHESPNQRPRSIQSNVNDDRRRTRWQDGLCEGEVEMRGEVLFNDDFTDVENIARGGVFSIELYDGEIERRVEIRHRRGENAERRWFVDGREREYDAEARDWLAEALTVFFRHSSYKADERIGWILSSRGVDGLLQEASQTHGGYLKRVYFEEAIRSGELSAAEIDQLIDQAADEISSDFELAQLLRAVPPDVLRNDALRRTYVAAAAEIDSDFEKRRVLSEILKQEGLSDQVVESLLRTAATMDSDFELAQLLTQIGDRYLGDDRLRAMYLEAADEVDSDFERRRVLSTLLEMEDLSNDVLLRLLQTAAEIDSDFELRQVLVGAAHRYVIDDALRVAFFAAVNTVDSDFEQRNVLQAVLEQGRPTPLVQQAVLESAMKIDSDFELATLLIEIAGSYLGDDAMRSTFFRAVETLDSDFERRRVLVGLIEDGPEDRAVVLGAVAAAMDIDSDFEKGQVLVQVARRYREDETVRSAVIEAADTISSDHEYGRVMSAVRGRR